MGGTPDRKRHDLIQALRILTSLVEFIEEGIDFNTDEGLAILAEAKQAKQTVESEIINLTGQRVPAGKN
jgi:hypothetical protein